MSEVVKLAQDLNAFILTYDFKRFADPLELIEIRMRESTNTVIVTQLDSIGRIDYVIRCKFDPATQTWKIVEGMESSIYDGVRGLTSISSKMVQNVGVMLFQNNWKRRNFSHKKF